MSTPIAQTAPTLDDLMTSEDLDSIVADLVYTLDELPLSTPAAPSGVPRAIVGRVNIAGALPCLVEVRLDLDGAQLLAQAMFDITPEATTEADVRDAVGEVANIVAGNTKSLADTDLRLGLPHTTVSGPATPPPTGALSTTHTWRGHHLTITITTDPTGEQS